MINHCEGRGRRAGNQAVRYYFLVAEGTGVVDDETGTDLADDNAAQQHAFQIIAELKADSSFRASNAEMIVMRGGEEIFRIPFASVP
jgi:hypothetical protein